MKSYKLTVELRDIVSDVIQKKRDELSKIKRDLIKLEELTESPTG
jgi:predicted transcriptional regulator